MMWMQASGSVDASIRVNGFNGFSLIMFIRVIRVPFLISVVTVIFVMTGDNGVVKSPD